jgi:DNA-binding transcriptional LysR family regulator
VLGHRVLAHARTILAAHDAALEDLGAAEARVLVIGVTEHGADVMLPGLTGALGDCLPDWRLRFRLDRNVSLADSIEHGLVDLAVMLDGSGWDRSNASGTVELKWISSRTFSVPASDPLPVVIFAEPCTLREPAFAILDKIGARYQVAAECCDLAGLYAAVRAGLGVALLPMIGRLPDGLCLTEGLPPANRASVFVRGRSGMDPMVLSRVDQAVRDVLAAQS